MRFQRIIASRTSMANWPTGPLFAIVSCAGIAVLPTAADAETASEIYRRMVNLYSAAKSFKGTINREERGRTPNGQLASQLVKIAINFRAPNEYVVDTVRTVTIGRKREISHQVLITDGKASFVYAPEKKFYQRGQIQDENALSRFFALVDPANGFLLLPETNIGGRAAFALTPAPPVNGTPAQLAKARKVTITFLVDKINYRFLRMTISSKSGTLKQSIIGQSIDTDVPASVFAWSPPPGYREIKSRPDPGGRGTISRQRAIRK